VGHGGFLPVDVWLVSVRYAESYGGTRVSSIAMRKEIVNKRRKITPYSFGKSKFYLSGQSWTLIPLHIQLMSKLCECTRVAIATNLGFTEWRGVGCHQ
jgi:hypothetical protein